MNKTIRKKIMRRNRNRNSKNKNKTIKYRGRGGDISALLKESSQLMDSINKQISDPVFKEKYKYTADNISKIASMTLESMDKPINQATEKIKESGRKLMTAAATGAIKVGTDVLAAVPFWGAFIELGKIANDGSKAVGEMAEASHDTMDIVSDLTKEFKTSMESNINILKNGPTVPTVPTVPVTVASLQNEKAQIQDRTNQSISNFNMNKKQ